MEITTEARWDDESAIKRVYEIFIVKGAKKNIGEHGGCLYSHDYNGFGCAMGCLFPRSLANRLEGIGRPYKSYFGMGIQDIVGDNSEDAMIVRNMVAQCDILLLRKLQNWHDMTKDVNDGAAFDATFGSILEG